MTYVPLNILGEWVGLPNSPEAHDTPAQQLERGMKIGGHVQKPLSTKENQQNST
jgi:hypothetical protein